MFAGAGLKSGIILAAKGLQAAQKPWLAAFGLGRAPAWAWPLALVGIVIQVGSIAYMCYTVSASKTDSSGTNTDEVQVK